jgi:phosphoribosylanthranilate isomerase
MSRIKLKICGVQSVEEAQQLLAAGVDYIGLNFVPISTRLITIETAEAIAASVRGSDMKIVALFQNQPLEQVNNYAHRLAADYVQLHGDEMPGYAKQITVSVIKAIAVDPAQSAASINNFIGSYLAGGLNAKNLRSILNQVQPFGIDIAGGVRTDGALDMSKVLSSVQTMRLNEL